VLLVAMPGTGDDVQANKAGILEVADVIALNKADRPGADVAEAELRLSLSLSGIRLATPLGHHSGHVSNAAAQQAGQWTTRIVRTIATQSEGAAELLVELDAHGAWLSQSESGRARRAARERLWLISFLRDVVADAALAELGPLLDELARKIAEKLLDPYEASEKLLGELSASAGRRG
jgi:LAO/AO transport system kinase